MPTAPGILARGPWRPEQIEVSWRTDEFEPSRALIDEADVAIEALRRRGSPSYDGLAARLVDFRAQPERLHLELQPMRWALRLGSDAASSLSAQCVVRDSEGRWLAGRRAAWLATWAGRWALGAAGSVEVDENPADTLSRELREEWSVDPDRMRIEALVQLPRGMALLVGQAWVPDRATVSPDAEHDEFAWWPPQVDQWPEEADEPLRRMGAFLGGTE
jgi:ADP-ribose pyrophosphatase YjhB (NUDIX family)